MLQGLVDLYTFCLDSDFDLYRQSSPAASECRSMFPLGWTFITLLAAAMKDWAGGECCNHLEKKFSFPLATVITALVWVVYLPLWLIQERVKVRFLPFYIFLCILPVSVWRFSTNRQPLSLPAWSFTAACFARKATIVRQCYNGGRYLSFQAANLIMTALLVGW